MSQRNMLLYMYSVCTGIALLLSLSSKDVEKLHPIFSPKDLLEVVIRVRDPNFAPCSGEQPDE